MLDFVGSPHTLEIARTVAATGGDIVIVGLAGGSLPVGFGTVPFETRVTVSFWGTKSELAEVVALAQSGKIRAHVEIFTLANAHTAYARLKAGTIQGRAVIQG